MESLASVLTYAVVLGLLVFALRRTVFSVTAVAGSLLPKRRARALDYLPQVTLLLAARNEEQSLAGTLEAIARLDYPKDRLQVLIIDDGSNDRTPEIIHAFTQANANFRHLRTGDVSVGKASALNMGLSAANQSEIVYVLDADSAPEPGCVRACIEHFANSRVGAVAGAPAPSTKCSTFASYYAYLETLVHRSVTTRAKDMLGLAPPIFGSNCAYRRSALDKIGGFKPGAFLEDTDLVLALCTEGYRTCYEPRAVSHMAMPRTAASYFRQHTRWTRGFIDVLGRRGMAILFHKRLPVSLRIELWLFSSGYLDRMFILAGILMMITDVLLGNVFGFPKWVLAVSLVSPACSILAALIVCREPLARHWRLPLLPGFFAIDVISTFKGMVDAVLSSPRRWHRVEREA